MTVRPAHVTLETILLRSPEVTHQTVGNEAVLLDLGSEANFGLKERALRAWEAFGGSSTLMQVVDVLAPDYEVDRARLEHDILTLAKKMAQEGDAVLASHP